MLLTLLCPTLLLHYFILQNCLNYFICHAFSVEIASEMVIDQYNHIIQQGEKYIVCKCLEKLKEKHVRIYYKSLPETVYVLPPQVLCPLVMLDEILSMSAADYQWLSDSI